MHRRSNAKTQTEVLHLTISFLFTMSSNEHLNIHFLLRSSDRSKVYCRGNAHGHNKFLLKSFYASDKDI